MPQLTYVHLECSVAAVQGFGILRPLSEAVVEPWMGAGGTRGSAA